VLGAATPRYRTRQLNQVVGLGIRSKTSIGPPFSKITTSCCFLALSFTVLLPFAADTSGITLARAFCSFSACLVAVLSFRALTRAAAASFSATLSLSPISFSSRFCASFSTLSSSSCLFFLACAIFLAFFFFSSSFAIALIATTLSFAT
jgi:ABC-type transport system involved in cytochrome c biogenesis permease subunit